MLAALAEGPSRITGFLRGDDCLATLTALRVMGVVCEESGRDEVVVKGMGLRGLKAPANDLDFGNSGTAMRLMAGLLSAQSFPSTLVGDASLMQRPMERVAVPLRLMGANVATVDGKPPIKITPSAGLRAIEYELPVASAQVKSAVLLAGLYAQGETRTTCSAVTRDHTERMLAGMGVDVRSSQRDHSASVVGPARLTARNLIVPGDFSSAAFFIVAGLIAGQSPLKLLNVGVNPTRIGLLHILRQMGARIDMANERDAGGEPVADLIVYRSELRGIEVPAEHVASAIDEFPILFVAAASAMGTTRVRGASELRHKESDRLAAMAAALHAVGVNAEETADGMDVTGSSISGGRVDSLGDHRIAMAMAVAGLRAAGEIEVLNTEPVATSFPGFVAAARSAGIDISAD